jgi:hypothetical protein
LVKGRVTPRDHAAAIAQTTSNVDKNDFQLLEKSHDDLNAHQTTVIVYNNEEWTSDFREFVRFSWRVQQQALVGGGDYKDLDLSQELQLVVFHPQATHQTYAFISHD